MVASQMYEAAKNFNFNLTCPHLLSSPIIQVKESHVPYGIVISSKIYPICTPVIYAYMGWDLKRLSKIGM